MAKWNERHVCTECRYLVPPPGYKPGIPGSGTQYPAHWCVVDGTRVEPTGIACPVFESRKGVGHDSDG